MRSVAAVVALVACLHAGAWALWQGQASAPNTSGILNSVSYSPFTTSAHPDSDAARPTEARIRAELKALAPYTRAIRLYSSTGGVELVPSIAAELGLKVTLGIWLDKKDRLSRDEIAALNQRATNDPANEAIVSRALGKLNLSSCKSSFEQDIARQFGFPCDSRNIREIRSGIDLLHKNRNVNALMVGNETLMRRDLTADELTDIIKRVKREVGGAVPVSTGEIYSELLGLPDNASSIPNPDSSHNLFGRWSRQLLGGEPGPTDRERAAAAARLVSSIDFVAAHVLPYWGDIRAEGAVDEAVRVYGTLRDAFPGKHIVIAEFGWPSAGYNRGAAVPGKLEQAAIMRSFVWRAQALGIDYNLIEAYDQPWKTMEGSVGAYWGLFDSNREPKFSWTGPVSDPDYWKVAAVAVAVGVLVSLPILGIAEATLVQVLLLALFANVVGAWTATVFDYWTSHYFVAGSAFALGLGTLLLIPLVLIALSRIDEIAAILFGRAPRRLLLAASPNAPAQTHAPKVSIHIPACMEPAEMLKATLDSVARLTYRNFECVLVVNNTPDPAMWQPVEEHCRTLGERFKFINAQKLEGYKAGALRLALAHTAPDAEIIGIIDADYAVTPDWLTDLVPHFADPKVGLVQAPQDHRDGSRSPLHYVMNGEYAGFFDIGMVQRNETNSIIVHGTMCLIRRTALDAAGGWSSDTICEDTDLGLSILELGWAAHYTNRRYGHGLLPDTFAAYKKQRDRWASGGFQIVRKHWRRFFPGASLLTGDQKREFAFGWINWLGAESVGVLVAILNLIWVPVVAFVGIAIPDKVLTIPIMASFAISILHFVALYQRRVHIPPGQAAGAMIAAMSMQWTVARAVAHGIVKHHLKFVRTAKGGMQRNSRKWRAFPAFDEAVLGSLLLVGSLIVFETNFERVREVNLFGLVLVVQSVPFIAAVALAAFENSRLNDFALWQSLEARFLELLPRRAPIAATPITATGPATAPEKNIDIAQ
jgi:cellulose synthase/poly-beta-1,6-N-acetylglucosamine synthase-like glycosyltransferase/exo-beta-1,3-glucanase (GH17 family)